MVFPEMYIYYHNLLVYIEAKGPNDFKSNNWCVGARFVTNDGQNINFVLCRDEE